MSQETRPRRRRDRYEGDVPREHYLNVAYGLKSWLFTVDHKRIAILYLVSISAFFALGGLFAAAIRAELMTPAGDLMSSTAARAFVDAFVTGSLTREP